MATGIYLDQFEAEVKLVILNKPVSRRQASFACWT
jgi:hypothetical protein